MLSSLNVGCLGRGVGVRQQGFSQGAHLEASLSSPLTVAAPPFGHWFSNWFVLPLSLPLFFATHSLG